MLLNVKMLNGSGFAVEVDDGGTIKDLKALLTDKCGWVPDDQKLIFRGRVLQDEQTYKEASLENGTALHLVHKPRPVDPPQREHTLHEAPEVDNMHGIHIETTPEMIGHNLPIDPELASRQRLEAVSRMMVRINRLMDPFEQPVTETPNEEISNSLFEPETANGDDMMEVSLEPPLNPTNIELSPTQQALNKYRELMQQVMRLTQRLLPYADIVSQAVVSPRRYTASGVQSYQHAYDSMAVLLHELSHLFHSLSDFIVDFNQPAESRMLRVPQRIEHRALLSTAITIPMTAVGVPNIGNLIAQQLNQMPGAHIGIPYGVGVSVHAVNNQQGLQQNNRPNMSDRNTGIMNSPILQGNVGANPTAQNDSNRNPTQSIAERIASIIGQMENRTQPNQNSATDNTEELERARILPCASHLNNIGPRSLPSQFPQCLTQFESRYVSPLVFASDMLCMASYPMMLKLMQYIHGRVDEARLERDAEVSLVKTAVKELLYQRGVCIFYGLLYSDDGVNFAPVIEDVKTTLTAVILECLRQIKYVLVTKSMEERRRFGLLDLFSATVPKPMRDLKCLFAEDMNRAQRYFKLLTEKFLPYASSGSQLLFQEELIKSFKDADVSLSKYHRKVKGFEKLPNYDTEEEDLDL